MQQRIIEQLSAKGYDTDQMKEIEEFRRICRAARKPLTYLQAAALYDVYGKDNIMTAIAEYEEIVKRSYELQGRPLKAQEIVDLLVDPAAEGLVDTIFEDREMTEE